MTNLYLDTAGAAPAPPPLAGEQRADVVVIGAGLTGLSTALHLAELGTRVVVLEAQTPGFGASGRNGGQVNPGLKADPDEVERRHGPDLGGRMVAFAGAAPQFVFDLIERLGLRCEARRNGTLRAAVRPKHVALVRATAEQWQRRGAPVEMLDAAGIAALTGTPRYGGALFDRRGGDLNPLLYTRGLAEAAVAAGAPVHGGSRVVELTPGGGLWRAKTPDGSVTAEQVVIATNGYSDRLWPLLRQSIVPVFSSIAATEPLPPDLAGTILPGRQVVYESGFVTVYYRVDAAGRLLIGGRGPMLDVRDPKEISAIVDYAGRLWPALRPLRWTHGWSGRIAMTADQYPHLHRPAAGVTICLGYSGRGVALATAAGAAIARNLVRPDAPLDLPVTKLETIPFHGYWPLAVPAAVQIGRLRDFIGI